MPAYDYSMDPSGFCLLSDYVPSAVQEIRYFSTFDKSQNVEFMRG